MYQLCKVRVIWVVRKNTDYTASSFLYKHFKSQANLPQSFKSKFDGLFGDVQNWDSLHDSAIVIQLDLQGSLLQSLCFCKQRNSKDFTL